MKTFKEFKFTILLEDNKILSPYWDRIDSLKQYKGKFNSEERNAYEHCVDLFNIMIDSYDDIVKSRGLDSFKRQLDNYLKGLEIKYLK